MVRNRHGIAILLFPIALVQQLSFLPTGPTVVGPRDISFLSD
jgi:hypothetical protein